MTTQHTIRVAVTHADALVSAGLCATLRQQADIAVADTDSEVDVIVADYDRALALLARPPGRGGRSGLPKVLVLTRRDSEREIRHALESGVRGYLTHGCGIEELDTAVRDLFRGVRHLGPTAARRLADSVATQWLTDRETDVLRLLVAGHSNKAIARSLDIALGTVKSHVKALFQKVDASSRTEVAALADQRGLLAPLPETGGSLRPPPTPRWRTAPARPLDPVS